MKFEFSTHPLKQIRDQLRTMQAKAIEIANDPCVYTGEYRDRASATLSALKAAERATMLLDPDERVLEYHQPCPTVNGYAPSL